MIACTVVVDRVKRKVEREGFEPSKANAGRFTVCSLWPLGHLSPAWSRWPESNWQPTDYKSVALPLSYTGSRKHSKKFARIQRTPCPLARNLLPTSVRYNVSSRCSRLQTSYMAIAPATEALSDSTPRRCGIDACRSQVPSTNGRSPVSPPRTSTGRGGRSMANRLRPPRGVKAMLQQPTR